MGVNFVEIWVIAAIVMAIAASITIFNVDGAEPGGSDSFSVLTGAGASALAGTVSAAQSSNPVEATITGGSSSATAGSVIGGAISEYPISNRHGGVVSGLIRRLWQLDPTKEKKAVFNEQGYNPLYLWARVTNHVVGQAMGMFTQGQRPDQIEKWNELYADNPLLSVSLHMHPFLNGNRAYRTKRDKWDMYLYDYLQTQPREDVLAQKDATNADELNAVTTPVSGWAQTQLTINPTDTTLQDWWADSYCDLITGSNESTLPNVGGDASHYMSVFNDSTSIGENTPNKLVYHALQNGTVASVTAHPSLPTHIKTVTLDAAPDGNVEDHPIWFFTGDNVWVVYRIQYSSGKVMTLRNLPRQANDTQTAVPAAGWKYCINDLNITSNSLDWGKNGTPLARTAGAATWFPGMKAVWDKLDVLVEEHSAGEHKTARGWNGISRSFTLKERTGFKVPHDMQQELDIGLDENASGTDAGFKRDTGDTHQYSIKNYDANKHMRSLYFAQTFIRNETVFTRRHGYGAFWEFIVYPLGEAGYDTLGTEDSHAMRYMLAAMLLVDKVNFSANVKSGYTTPYMIGENFIDLDRSATGYITPGSELGTYAQDSGELGDDDLPLHGFTFRAKDAGEKIFIYRVKDWIVALNMCDTPDGYGDWYRSPGGSNPFPVRPEDQITPADWAAVNLLQSGERLRRFDERDYINYTATSFLRAQAPTVWTDSYHYGPLQETPFDTTCGYTLENAGFCGHDTDWNNGEEIDVTSDTIHLPPYTALFMEVF
ncbi:MAG: hypothetical protein GOVbin7744_18 [Prokaryotic dsDNA virus sp.]|nr:MAG: hypothetical protein GOVbin7744_18 [Prokaryotic dsDNA virus sp.]|tara:strand:+ start:3085 stop:5388 length:2304 start_codon:yes stop_codon:yes gene_type:complete